MLSPISSYHEAMLSLIGKVEKELEMARSKRLTHVATRLVKEKIDYNNRIKSHIIDSYKGMLKCPDAYQSKEKELIRQWAVKIG